MSDVWYLNLNPEKLALSNYEPTNLKLEWKPIGHTHIPCHFHSSAYNSKSNTLYMFGGNTVVKGRRGEELAKRINIMSSLRKS